MISLKHGYRVRSRQRYRDRKKTDVIGKELPVADFVVMQVAESIESLAHDKSGLCFSQVLLLSDEEEKFTTFTEPRDEIKISLAFKLVSLS